MEHIATIQHSVKAVSQPLHNIDTLYKQLCAHNHTIVCSLCVTPNKTPTNLEVVSNLHLKPQTVQ